MIGGSARGQQRQGRGRARRWAGGVVTVGAGEQIVVVTAPSDLGPGEVPAYWQFLERELTGYDRLHIARGRCAYVDQIAAEAKRCGYGLVWVRDRFEHSGWTVTRPRGSASTPSARP